MQNNYYSHSIYNERLKKGSKKNDIRCWNANLRYKSPRTNGFGRSLFKITGYRKNLFLLVDNDDFKPIDIERITLDLNEQIDEFSLLTYDGDYANQIEVVTKEQAEENEKDFINEEYGYSKDDVDSYEVGGCLSVYKKLGESDYYYREL